MRRKEFIGIILPGFNHHWERWRQEVRRSRGRTHVETLLTGLLTRAHPQPASLHNPGPPAQRSHHPKWVGPSCINPQSRKFPHRRSRKPIWWRQQLPSVEPPSCVKLRHYLLCIFAPWIILGRAIHIESWLWTKHFHSTMQQTAMTSENTNDNSLLYDGSPF